MSLNKNDVDPWCKVITDPDELTAIEKAFTDNDRAFIANERDEFPMLSRNGFELSNNENGWHYQFDKTGKLYQVVIGLVKEGI